MTKKDQLKKNKPVNQKKLSYVAWHNYVDWINDISNGICQICESNHIADMHHSRYGYFGAEKDDRYMVGICRKCHEECHKDKRGSANTKAARIGKRNWKEYKCE